jgi:hypothetical protein
LRHIFGMAVVVLALGAAASAASAASVTLHWTAPGDDSLSGRAASYDLRYATYPITSQNWFLATQVIGEPSPAMPGQREGWTISGLNNNTMYYFALRTLDDAGNWSLLSNVVSKSTASTVDVPGGPVTTLHFSSPHPNPARGSTAFSLGLPQPADVHVAAFDIQGRQVKTLLSGSQPAGEIRLAWKLDDSDGRALGPGIYLVRARLGSEWFERRVTVVR